MTDCAGQRADGPQHDTPDPTWCPSCKAAIRRKLTALDYQAAMLAFRIDGFGEKPESPSRVSGSRPSPSPAANYIDELTGWLWDWEDIARKEVFHLPASMHFGYLPEIRSAVIAWLAERLDGILAGEYTAAFGQEVIDRHRELLKLNKALPPRTGLVPCPRCGRKLAWLDGRDGLQCSGCNRTMDAAEYEAEVNAARRQLEQAG